MWILFHNQWERNIHFMLFKLRWQNPRKRWKCNFYWNPGMIYAVESFFFGFHLLLSCTNFIRLLIQSFWWFIRCTFPKKISVQMVGDQSTISLYVSPGTIIMDPSAINKTALQHRQKWSGCVRLVKAGPPWFEFLVIFDFCALWYRRGIFCENFMKKFKGNVGQICHRSCSLA